MTAPVAAPVPTRSRAAGLDVLRGMAAFGVLVTHVAFVTGVVNPQRWSSPLRDVLPRLDVGVWVFFVLSGLLVSRPFVRAVVHDDGAPATGAYLWRRAGRVMPLYWVALAVTLAGTAGAPGAAELAADALLLHIYRPEWAIGPITQSWSLATEVAFYLFLPLWFLVARRWFRARGIAEPSRRVRWLAVGLVGWAAMALAYRTGVVAVTETFDYTRPGTDVRGALLTWLPNHLDTFAVGVGLALWLESGRAPRIVLPVRLACYAVAALALWTASTRLDLPPLFTGFDGPQTFARHALFVTVAAALVAPSALASAHGARATRAGPARIAAWIALGSYGVYLWHQWITDEWFDRRDLAEFRTPFPTTLVVVVVVSSLVAAVTYRLIERPAADGLAAVLRWRPDRTPRVLGQHPGLDGIRGLSIAAVMASHVIFLDDGRSRFALDGGFLGVDVFLVLSGFLIGATLLREVDRDGRVAMGAFLRRRARRLLPPLIGFFAVHAVVVAILGDSLREELLQAVLALTFVGNWQLTFHHQPPYDLVHLWSLAVEGQLYVACGAIVSGCRDVVRRRPWAVVGGLLAAAAVVGWWRYAQFRAGHDVTALYERTDIRADSMLVGLAVAVVWRSRLVPTGWLRVGGLAGGLVLAGAILRAEPGAPWLFRGGFSVVAVAGAAVVVAAALDRGPVAVLGRVGVLRWLGRISYSLYLWHLPVFLWVVRAQPDAPIGAKVAVAMTAAVAAGWLAFRLFEQRFLAGWRRVPQRQTDTLTPAGAESR